MNILPRFPTVEDAMTSHVHVASPTTPFKLLARFIEENGVGAVPIVDRQGVPMGVVSDADLLMEERPEDAVASDLMMSPAICVPSSLQVVDAARLMDERGVKRLVVVDGRGRIAGIVSRSDLTDCPG